MTDVAWRYAPNEPGDHFYGVPARDLTADEYAALSGDQQALVGAGACYVPVAAAPARASRVPGARPVVPLVEGEVA